jgi:hypothetical protein
MTGRVGYESGYSIFRQHANQTIAPKIPLVGVPGKGIYEAHPSAGAGSLTDWPNQA